MTIESCAVLTTEANERVRPVHDQMPVILPATDYATWLDPDLDDAETFQRLLRPYPAERMVATAVSTRVNSPRNDDPECVKPVGTVEGGRSLWDDASFNDHHHLKTPAP